MGGEPSVPGFGSSRAVVIGAGEAAETVPYEIFATTNRAEAEDAPTCIFLGFPTVPDDEADTAGICLNNALQRSLEDTAVAELMSPAFEEPGPPSEQYVLRVLTRPEVSRVAITYLDESDDPVSVDVAGARLDEIQGRAIDIDDRAGFSFGFLPLDVIRGDPEHPRCLTEQSVEGSLARIEISAYDADGELIETSHPQGAIQFLFRPPEGYRSWVSTRLDGPPFYSESEYCEASAG
ncbi:hypothetical protein HJD18_03420 [Thermoleophilia bacterium SCSIO 60948]|nr:hypothetical protein HJD18_03420 [Thermoleophilia bacterium SCSIO 60948]